MTRLRLGVALLVPPPHDVAIDGLRRALGDGALTRIPPHLTLVPPVNVREERLDEVLDVVRAAAHESRPITVNLGSPTTFLPDNPVIYLPIMNGADAVARLRDRMWRDPLARDQTYPFVPHVTVADEASPERITSAIAALASFAAVIRFDRVHLLQENPGRIWVPIADATLGPPAVVG